MKRLSILIIFMLGLLPLRAFAQSEVITLNDATTAIDVVISTPQGTTGAVGLQFTGAAVSLTDGTGATVFQVADPRVHGLEFHFAPDAAPHTLTVQRLPGVTEAFVTVNAQTDMIYTAEPTLIETPTLALGNTYEAALSSDLPSQVLDVTLTTKAEVLASFPGAPVMAQVVDDAGVVISTLSAGQVDGFSLAMDDGQYELTLLNTDTNYPTVAAVSVLPAAENTLPEAIAAQETPPAPVAAAPATNAACSLTVSQSSIGLHTGPGAGYSAAGYAFRNEQLAVGGINPEQNWVLVGTASGSAWVHVAGGTLTGDCTALTTFNIPLREAPAPQITIQQSSGGYFGDDDDDEHESEEHEHEGEEEGDDD